MRLDYCRELSPPGLEQVRSLGRGRSVDASSIRNILTGADKTNPPHVIDPRGVVICGAWIRGELNLDGVTAAIGLRFTGCRFDKPLNLCDAKLPWLFLDTCVLPAVTANRTRVDTLSIRGCELDGRRPDGLIRLAGAQVASEFRLAGTRLANRSGPALTAPGLSVGTAAPASARSWTVSTRPPTRTARRPSTCPGRRSAATSCCAARGWQGTVLLRGGTISGQLSLEHARVSCGPAEGGPPPHRRRSVGAVCLSGSTIAGHLVLRHAQLAAATMSALMAENLTVKGHAGACESRHEGLSATGSGPLGAVCLAGASVTGQLSLRGTTLVNESGPALLADLITIGDGARLDQDFSAEGEGRAGGSRRRGQAGTEPS